jgi:hypothetical protein
VETPARILGDYRRFYVYLLIENYRRIPPQVETNGAHYEGKRAEHFVQHHSSATLHSSDDIIRPFGFSGSWVDMVTLRYHLSGLFSSL